MKICKILLPFAIFYMVMFILISLPNIIIDSNSYKYYYVFIIVVIIMSIILFIFLIKKKKKIIGFLLMGVGIITIVGCLIMKNGINLSPLKVVSVSSDSIVLTSDDMNYKEIKKPPIVSIKKGDYIYIKSSDKTGNMHYIINPNFGKGLIIIGSIIIVLYTFYSGYIWLYTYKNKERKKYEK